MGSWSVYCGVSNIAITAGDTVGIIPLLKRTSESHGYSPYLPAMLPIFGTYDDYGGIEDIKENANTKLIEEYFGVSIQEFVVYLVDGHLTYDREEAREISDKLLHSKEANKLYSTFISGDVYDYLSKTAYGEEGRLDFGNKIILELLGFKYIETLPVGRYKEVYELQGKKMFTDGTWGNIKIENKEKSIFYLDNKDVYSKENNLTTYFNIPENKLLLVKKAMWQIEAIYTTSKVYAKYVFGSGYDGSYEDTLVSLIKYSESDKDLGIDIGSIDELRKKLEKMRGFKSISEKYLTDLKVYGKDISDLYTIIYNITNMSKCLEPYILYVTPQCGEHKIHLKLLNGFSKILESKVSDEDY